MSRQRIWEFRSRWLMDEASQALLSLGYSRQEVEAVLKRMTRGQSAVAAVPELVRSALKDLGKGEGGLGHG
jgi:Holliday junction resolvasome RuvABC DNA-binding subunit